MDIGTIKDGATRLGSLVEALELVRGASGPVMTIEVTVETEDTRHYVSVVVNRTKLIEFLASEENHVGSWLAKTLRGRYE